MTNEFVKTWQRAIGVEDDGWFWSKTLKASMALIPTAGLQPPPSPPREVSTFIGPAKRLDDIDLPRIGARIGVGEDEIHAVMDVEAPGSGFDSLGRPKMLFEPHVFRRQLGPGAKLDQAVAEGLAYEKWKPGAYPADSYPRLQRAILIDREAALKSASWGRGQIMGYNYSLAGFDHVEAMIVAFMADEETHIDAMVSYIIATQLDDDLRDHNWTNFARGYNGPGYAANNYDWELASAFSKWQDIRDTPFTLI